MDEVAELASRAKQGDGQAFGALYDRFAPLVRAVGYDATASLPEAEDLCQEVFLQAYRKLGQLREVAYFPGWLMGIARRTAADWRRSCHRRPQLGLDGLDLPDPAAELCPDETQRLLETLAQLPAQERQALHLFYLTEQPASLARQTLGLSDSGFYKLLNRAKKRLASLFRERKVIR